MPALRTAHQHLIHFATNIAYTKNASQYGLGCTWNASSKWENYADGVCNIAESVFSFFIRGGFSFRGVWHEYKLTTDSNLNDRAKCKVLKWAFQVERKWMFDTEKNWVEYHPLSLYQSSGSSIISRIILTLFFSFFSSWWEPYDDPSQPSCLLFAVYIRFSLSSILTVCTLHSSTE